MPSAAGSAATGAVSGAAAGSAFGPWGTAAGAIIGGVGGYLGAEGTSDAQKEANKVAAQQAAQQSAQSFQNYLSSRGINLQQLVAKFPDLTNDYNRARTQAGETRDFNTWLYAAITSQPGHPIWDAIANPTVGNGAANTTLPAWAVDANGNPLQPELLQQLLGISTGNADPRTAPIGTIATLENARALLQSNPELAAGLAQAGVGNDGRTPEQWLVDHITQTEAASGGGTYTDALRNSVATRNAATGGAAGTGAATTLDPAIAAIIPKATTALNGVFDGTYLNETNAALKPVLDARSAIAALQGTRTNELRGLSGDLRDTELSGIANVLNARTGAAGSIYDASKGAAQGEYDANITKLADLLGVRRDAAQQIYDASLTSAGGVRDARTTGAQNIYGAESLRADTYAQAAEQALNRLLSEQSAERARRGFTGGSSGSDITRSRLRADYIQRGAGARADAGVNLQTRLSDAGLGYATDTGAAGVNRATTLGRAGESDAMAKLTAAVDLAHSLGLAGVNRATTVGQAGEQDAIARLTAQADDARRRMGYLTADTDIAAANADYQNAIDSLNALTTDQNRKIGAVGAPYTLAGADLGLKGALTDQSYGQLDALLKRLNSFSIGNASGPSLTTAQQGSVLNGTQVAGGALSSLGSIVSSISSNKDLMDLIKSIGGSGSATPSGTPNPVTGSILSSPNFLAGASVFKGPNG